MWTFYTINEKPMGLIQFCQSKGALTQKQHKIIKKSEETSKGYQSYSSYVGNPKGGMRMLVKSDSLSLIMSGLKNR